MAKVFGDNEHRILGYFDEGTRFNMGNQEYEVVLSGKPTCYSGEPKTDIYILAESLDGQRVEIKISFKQSNADFLENKTNAERAEQLFGYNWQSIITDSTQRISDEFYKRPLIYKNSFGRTQAGSITLGWKFEILNVESGALSSELALSFSQLVDVYSGSNLSADKRNASVHGRTITDCGIANYIVFEDEYLGSAQDVIDALITIDNYVRNNSEVYFACKALNYRTYARKYDGNRPLAVMVRWFVRNGKLAYNLVFDEPLLNGGDDAFDALSEALYQIGAQTVDDLDEDNVEDPTIIY